METTEIKRPLVLSIISWLIIVGAVLSPLMVFMMRNNTAMIEMMEKGSQLPLMVQYGLMVVGSIIALFSAINMLKGKQIGRTIYVVYSVIALAINFFASNAKETLFGSIIIMVVVIGLLFLPNISKYFNAKSA